ncbi:hypothetical protein SLA_1979 [Streptomyces laurentii]|uniref:Uncharacterized protein n=1 Tax=Streptomyces laurentii TaxID=39478 RepID=A0A160NXT7_STRLU|nr:hypothetical protein SLA_1979 [Streptomyces laurentii]
MDIPDLALPLRPLAATFRLPCSLRHPPGCPAARIRFILPPARDAPTAPSVHPPPHTPHRFAAPTRRPCTLLLHSTGA